MKGTKPESRNIPSLVKDPKLIETRRLQIVRAAVDLFIRKGFHKTTTREIAGACGFSIGTLYEYIQSKEDVLYLVCINIHEELEQRLKQVRDDQGTGKQSLVKAIRQLFLVMEEMKEAVLLIYQETKSLPKESMLYVLKKEEEITNIFEQILQKGQGDGSLSLKSDAVKLMAHNIMVLGQMWTFRRWVIGKHYSLKEYTEYQTSLILRELSTDV